MTNNKGYTLTEILIVLAVLALLFMVAIPNIARVRQEASEAKTIKELKSLYTAIVMYESDNKKYPNNWNELADYINIERYKDDYDLNPDL